MFIITCNKLTKEGGETFICYQLCVCPQKISGIKHIKLITVVTSEECVYVREELFILYIFVFEILIEYVSYFQFKVIKKDMHKTTYNSPKQTETHEVHASSFQKRVALPCQPRPGPLSSRTLFQMYRICGSPGNVLILSLH